MSLFFKISFGGYLLVAIMLAYAGIMYLTANKIMPYHLKAMESNWHSLTSGMKVMSLNFMKVASAGFITTSIAICFLLFFPFRNGESWAIWALPIVDVQVVQFVREKFDGMKLFKGEQLIENIETLIKTARDSNTPIVYVQYTDNENSFMGIGQSMWDIHPQIKPNENDIRIIKYHADPFYKTNLYEKLKALGVNKLIIVGLQTEFCIDTTCRCAYSLGYKNILVSDGHSAFDSDILSASQIIEHHNKIIGGQVPFAELKETSEIEF